MIKGPFTQPKPLSIIIIVFQSLKIIFKTNLFHWVVTLYVSYLGLWTPSTFPTLL